MAKEEKLTAEQLDYGRWLFAQQCDFVMGCAKIEQLPPGHMKEIAFAGRSNVGKSSLINALTGRNTLVKTSKTPGHTQQLNFFNLKDKLMLVDLPGYGYAKVSKDKKHAWDGLIKNYLRGRPNLRRVLILIDSRHGVKPGDIEIMKILDESAVSYQLVFTKADKLRPSEEPVLKFDKSSHPALMSEFFLTSSEKKTGVNELQAALAQLVDN